MGKLTEIQQQLKAPKSQTNDFGKYKYRSCEDILEAVKPLLNGCTLTLSDKMVQLGDRYYVEATAIFMDGPERTVVTAYAREQEIKKGMDAAQITGACSSYARKYALNGLFLIDDTKDADTMDNTKPTTNDKPKSPDPRKKPQMTKDDWNAIQGIGYNLSLTDAETKDIVKWKCAKEKINVTDIKVLEYFTPFATFDKTLAEYSAFKMEEK